MVKERLVQGPFELNTSLSNRTDLEVSDLSSYDAVYIGNSFCRIYEDNFLERLDDLRQAIRYVKGLGKRVYVCTYAVPRNVDVPQVRKVLEVAASEGVDAVEAHNLGIVRMAHREFPMLRLHVGGFANVYTDLTALVLKGYTVWRLTPNYELSLDEIDSLRERSGLEIELLLHGKIPLGVSHECFLLAHQEAAGIRCPQICQKDWFLRGPSGMVLKSVGKWVTSGTDMCMLEHLPMLLTRGYRIFRLETISETPTYRARIGRVYREALTTTLDGAQDGFLNSQREWLKVIHGLSPNGLSNGYYFGRTGREYVDVGVDAIR
jgi:putative protease